VILILAGVILLLNVLGTLEWSIWWSILRLWPVLLIAAGLELLLGRWWWGGLVSTILVVAVVVIALWLTTTGMATGDMETAVIRQPLGDATRAEVSINPGVGALHLGAASEPASLIEGTIEKTANESIQEDFSQQSGTAFYSLGTKVTSWTAFPGGFDQSRLWDLDLTPGASLALDADMGVGDTELDLSGLDLEALSADMGMGRIKIILPATGQFEAKLSGGIGLVEIVIPRGMAVRIEADTALAAQEMPDDLVKDEDYYTSPGFFSAANRVEIDAGIAIGLLNVRYQE
jgi:hypothetical protein